MNKEKILDFCKLAGHKISSIEEINENTINTKLLKQIIKLESFRVKDLAIFFDTDNDKNNLCFEVASNDIDEFCEVLKEKYQKEIAVGHDDDGIHPSFKEKRISNAKYICNMNLSFLFKSFNMTDGRKDHLIEKAKEFNVEFHPPFNVSELLELLPYPINDMEHPISCGFETRLNDNIDKKRIKNIFLLRGIDKAAFKALLRSEKIHAFLFIYPEYLSELAIDDINEIMSLNEDIAKLMIHIISFYAQYFSDNLKLSKKNLTKTSNNEVVALEKNLKRLDEKNNAEAYSLKGHSFFSDVTKINETELEITSDSEHGI